MAAQDLTTAGSGSGGAQTATGDPQNSVQSDQLPGQTNQSVQSGTANSLLTSTQGISLQNLAVPTVGLGTTTATSTPKANTSTTKHTVHPGFVAVAILLFAIAIGSFWSISRSEKNTTN